MIRLFTAIELPVDLRRRMAMICGGIDNARWVAEENLHLTLRFIGDVPEDVADDLLPVLASVRQEPFSLTIAGAGHFGNRRHVHTLWLGVEKCPPLNALYDRLESALVRAGLEPERRKFLPHITLARLKDGSPREVQPWLSANSLFRAMPFDVEGFALFSSHMGRSGADYTLEHRFPLPGRISGAS